MLKIMDHSWDYRGVYGGIISYWKKAPDLFYTISNAAIFAIHGTTCVQSTTQY